MTSSKSVYAPENRRRFQRLLIATAGMVYLLIVIGGIVRVTGSGLGCPDWPRCFGEWIPPLRMDAIIEYTHRLVATLTSPLILASAFVAWLRYKAIPLATRSLLIAAVLLAFQGLLGGIVVLLETPPNLVALHLAIAFIIQALVTMPAVLLSQGQLDLTQVRLNFSAPIPRQTLNNLVFVFIMIVSGAIVVGSNSTYACSGWPLCNGQILPSNPSAYFHMGHRLMVLITSYFIVRTFFAIRALPAGNSLHKVSNIAFGLFLLQTTIGALKVSYSFPVWLQGFHVAVASAVWVAYIVLASKASLSESKNLK
jgi:heme A synthase